jgi:hypothetical protein
MRDCSYQHLGLSKASNRLRIFRAILLFAALMNGYAIDALAAVPDFKNDVMAVLSKAGCNAGACHGNQNGKGGFKLSLRGQDPQRDYQTLVREYAGRRIDRLDADNSLILLKPTARLAHQGGLRFRHDSLEYQILRDWISAGAPAPRDDTPRLVRLEVTPREQVIVEPEMQLQLCATAVFSDGSRRDVKSLAVYEASDTSVNVGHDGLVSAMSFVETTVLVRYLSEQLAVRLAFIPARADFVWSDPPASGYIDQHVFAKLRSLRINPSEMADDFVFVRRAYLDALGVLPSADEARAFVADRQPDKRSQLIDELLLRPEFADHWALKWADLLRNEEKVLDQKGVEVFHGWIRESIANGKPLDQFVRELVSARGSSYQDPPSNYYRANRDPTTRGETTARLFLGTRLQCAKCHNHPFERWTQDDYYSWAALFAQIDYQIVDNNRKDKLDKNEFVGEQIVLVNSTGEVKNQRTGSTAQPRFLGGAALKLDADADRLEPLGSWLTSPDNALFARSQVNWIWYHLMGRGLVEPVDDFRETNPPVNPPLLAALAQDFVESGFDLRHIVRVIMNSRIYQLDALPNETNRDDVSNFSRAIVGRLTAEKLLDAQCQVLDAPADFAGYDPGLRAGQIPGVQNVRPRDKRPGEGDRFLKTFGKPDRLLACECERSNETTLSQAFVLIGGPGLNQRLAQSGNRLDRLSQSPQVDAEVIDELYWTALSRPPTDAEMSAAIDLLSATPDRFVALQDLTWALLNAKEFVFRR